MFDVKLTTCAPQWPWARQTPAQSLEWGPFRFHVDTQLERCDAWVVFESLSAPEETVCPPENVLFIAGEPDSIGSYHDAFLEQFFQVVSGRMDLRHDRQIRIQQGHPWFVEKSYDELMLMPPLTKTRDISVISSNKAFTVGHRARLDFVGALKQRFGDRVDVWGRGIRDFDQKWEALAPYKYALVLENFSGPNFLTEKLPDALLAYCFPIYYGCSNVGRYFHDDASLSIDIEDTAGALACIERLLSEPEDYPKRLADITRARLEYLNHLQFFANLSNILQVGMGMSEQRPAHLVRLLPNSEFRAIPPAHVDPTPGHAPEAGNPLIKGCAGILTRLFTRRRH